MPWTYDEEAYVYVRPANLLRIFEVSDIYAVWREEGDLIISDTASLGIKYVYDHDNPSKYPALFVEAFVDKLAFDISFMILNSGPKAEAFLEKYRKVTLPTALSANAQTGTQQQVIDDEWELAKYQQGLPSRSYS